MEENKAVVTKVCYMYARDSEHFKDLYQETLINIWQALPRFKKEAAPSSPLRCLPSPQLPGLTHLHLPHLPL